MSFTFYLSGRLADVHSDNLQIDRFKLKSPPKFPRTSICASPFVRPCGHTQHSSNIDFITGLCHQKRVVCFYSQIKTRCTFYCEYGIVLCFYLKVKTSFMCFYLLIITYWSSLCVQSDMCPGLYLTAQNADRLRQPSVGSNRKKHLNLKEKKNLVAPGIWHWK